MKRLLGIIMCLGCSLISKAQRQLDVNQSLDYQYVMKVDAINNKLVRSTDPLLLPWLPKYQFGWRIQDQNYFDLFFQHAQNPLHELNIDFYEYLVLSIIKYDQFVWDLSLLQASYDEDQHTISIHYDARKRGNELSHFQTSTLLLLIRKSKHMKRVSPAKIKYTVKEKNYSGVNDPVLSESGIKFFPSAYTEKKLLNSSDVNINLIDLLSYYNEEMDENPYALNALEVSDTLLSDRGVKNGETEYVNENANDLSSDAHMKRLMEIRAKFEQQQKRVKELHEQLYRDLDGLNRIPLEDPAKNPDIKSNSDDRGGF